MKHIFVLIGADNEAEVGGDFYDTLEDAQKQMKEYYDNCCEVYGNPDEDESLVDEYEGYYTDEEHYIWTRWEIIEKEIKD